MLPPYELWKQSTSVSGFGSGSKEWQDLDKAYKDYSESQGDYNKRKHLENMLDAFDEAKKKKYASINIALTPGEAEKKSDRDRLGAITSLRRYLKNWQREYDREDLVALQEIKRGQNTAVRRTLSNAKITYKSNRIKIAKSAASATYDLVGTANDARSGLKALADEFKTNVPGINAIPLQGDALTVSTGWQSMLRSITGVEADLQEEAMQALTREIGEKVLADISGYIPVLGVVKDGLSVFMSMKGVVDNELIIYRNDKARPLTRKGDIEAAINSLQTIFEKKRVELGIDLAGSVSALVTGVVSSGVAGPVTNAVVSVAKLVNSIRNFVNDHTLMTRANKVLDIVDSSDAQLLEIMEKFPFIGAHLIATIETSTLIEIIGYELNNPFHQLVIESINNKIAKLRESARDIIKESRFELVITNDREIAATRRALDIAGRRAKELGIQRTQALVEERERELAAQRARDLEAQKERALAAQQAKALAEQQARELAEHQKKIAAAQTALQEKNQAKLRALQQKVKQALATYRDQTTGFKSLVTRQSTESTAAIAELTSLVSSTSVQDLSKLQATVEYLLKKPVTDAAAVNRSLAPLKQPSRLFDLLNPAYLAAR
jgi:hypothetical protein